MTPQKLGSLVLMEHIIKDPGGAQETTMYMSLLFAISDLTTLKRKKTIPDFDAPTSSLRISNRMFLQYH